ncbi:snoRNP complex protein nop56 [Mactra antiquata]
MAQSIFVLYEHASGYGLFRVKEFEEVGMLQPEVEAGVTDLSKFKTVVNLTAFSPFKSGTNALDNMNSISEGVLHDDLRLFIETNVPKSSKKQKVILGVGDSKIGASITEEMKVSCQHTGIVPEIIRGIRVHFHNLVKGLTEISASKAQLGLGHSYSRAKVKFNVNRVDNMIIQSIALLDQLDKNINTFAMRIREWYSYHFPELVKIVNDNHMYCRVAKLVKNRKEFTEEKIAELEEIVMDEAVVKAICDASKSSMGMDISVIDLINIEMFATKVISLVEYRKSLSEYLKSKMAACAPNLSSLIGEQVGARLIAHAGSLTNLAKYPASTVQILGAEKALFRALKTRGNTPKYGLIFHSTFIGRAGAKNKGRISRYLANKCSIASRIDCFSDIPTSVYGEFMRQQVEDRLKFYETGEAPKKNVDVMHEAMLEAAVVQEKLSKKQKKKKKKDKKRKLEEAGDEADTTVNTTMDTTADSSMLEEPPKKKKKKKHQDAEGESEANVTMETSQEITDDTPSKKKKKKKKNKQEN